jgi:hypothetical protein
MTNGVVSCPIIYIPCIYSPPCYLDGSLVNAENFQKVGDSMGDCKNIKLHFMYSVGILLGLLALVMTDRWTAHENFTEYLSNSATLVSLVLGLVAIFYSFTSNTSLSQSLGNIAKVSEEILQTKHQLGEFIKEAKALEESGAQNTEILKTVSISVESNVSSLQAALNEIGMKTEDLHETVSSMPIRFDAFAQKVLEANDEAIAKAKYPISTQNSQESELTADKNSAKSFMGMCSISGGFLIYAIVLATNSNKPIVLPSLKEFALTETEYLYGFFVATTAAGFIKYEDVAGSDKTFMIRYIDPDFPKYAKDYLLANIDYRYGEESTSKDGILKRVEDMEKSFKESKS